MPLGVTTLAQFNGADGLGDDASTTQMYVGVGAIAILLGTMIFAGATARSLVANKKSRKGKHRRNGVRAAAKRRPHRARRAAAKRYCVHYRCPLGFAGTAQSGSMCRMCGQDTVFGHPRAR